MYANNTWHWQSAFRPRTSGRFAKQCGEPHTSCEVGQIYCPRFADGETEAQRRQGICLRVPQILREGTRVPGTPLPLAHLSSSQGNLPGASCLYLSPVPAPAGAPEPSPGTASSAPGQGFTVLPGAGRWDPASPTALSTQGSAYPFLVCLAYQTLAYPLLWHLCRGASAHSWGSQG